MNRPARLLLIDPSTRFSEERGLQTLARYWPGDVVVSRPALCPGDGPDAGSGYDFDAVVLMGSRASANDDLPWERELGDWLAPLLAGSTPLPLLGICFGHQMIAHAAGGEIGFVRPDRSKLVGVEASELRASRLAHDVVLRVAVSHAEEVKRLPEGFRTTGFREGVMVDGFEHETLPVFGVQFHPEADGGFLEKRGVRVTDEQERALREASDKVIGGFFAVALRERARRDSLADGASGRLP